MMTQGQSAEVLFEQALALHPEERSAFLDRACLDSAQLRAMVEDLLIRDAEAGDFLKEPLFGYRSDGDSLDEETTWTDGALSGATLPAWAHRGQFREGDILSGRFRVVRFIANGGMGEVYEVVDQQLQGVHLALKTILPHIAERPDMHKRFEREVLLARRVVHANLCPIYDIFHCRHCDADVTFLTMKLLSGKTLAAHIKDRGPLPLAEASPIIFQVADALTAAHEAGILHRDIKAANIMLEGEGERVRACVMDFGLARAYRSESTVLTADGVAGTPGYVAPELFQGAAPSTASDVYAFGVMIYSMLTGHLPPVKLSPKTKSEREPLFEKLPGNWKAMIERCVEPDVANRYKTIAEAVGAVRPGNSSSRDLVPMVFKLSRRRMIGLGAAAGAVAAAGVSLNWPRISFLFEPLPEKRFVALMAWPADDSSAVLATVLKSIGSRLARAEATVKNLLIISSSDLVSGKSLKSPSESVYALGANLVLAASLTSTAAHATLTLQVVEAATQRILRKAHVTRGNAELSNLPDAGCEVAAALLGLPDRETTLKDPDELLHVSPEVFRMYTEAEQLAAQPNHAGLQSALEKYRDAVNADPHFALGYARLAMAYTRQYYLDHSDVTLTLAQANAARSLNLNPDSANGLLSQALTQLYSGNTNEALKFFAKSLQADAGNPESLLYEAQAYRNLSKWAEAERVYRDILKERPNYWLAYNELGWMLARQAKYRESAEAFEAAATVAPSVALPLANLGTIYLDLGKRDEAKAALNLSLQRAPNEDAYLTLGTIEFDAGKYNAALSNYQSAARINPKAHLIWRNIGDCYAVLGQPDLVKKNYAVAAQLLSATLSSNPKGASSWATLAFYHAKIGETAKAEADLENVEAQGAKDVESQFLVVQTLALLGKKEEAIRLLLACMDRGISPVEVGLALDVKSLQKDPRYLAHLRNMHAEGRTS